MATYKASSFYEVKNGNSTIKFDWLGNYETADASEIKALDALVPTWIKRIDEPEQSNEPGEPENGQTEATAKDKVGNAEKSTAKGRKSSAK